MNTTALQFPTITALLLQPQRRLQDTSMRLQKATLANTIVQPRSILHSAKGAECTGFRAIKITTYNNSYSFPANTLLTQYSDDNKTPS